MPPLPINENDIIRQLQRRAQPQLVEFSPDDIERILKSAGVIERDFIQRVTVLAEQLAAGRITLSEWKTAMRDELRRYHLTNAIIGAGGLALAGAGALLIAQSRTVAQIKFFNEWTNQIERGDFPIDAEARLRQRATLYAGAGQATLDEAMGNAMGIPRLPAYPRDGQTQCMNNCKCRWEYTKLPGLGNWDCRWVMGVAEHCQHCPRRAQVWNPLQVRNGVIQPYNSTGLFKTA